MNVSLMPQPPTSGSMTGSKKMTDEKFGTIPGLIAEGKTTIEIAALFGVTPGTLRVYCSNRDISLRKGGKQLVAKRVAQRQPAVVEATQLVSLRMAAQATGLSALDLVSQLIPIIVEG